MKVLLTRKYSSIQLIPPEVGSVATTEFLKFVKDTRESMVVPTRGIAILTSRVKDKKPIKVKMTLEDER